MPDRKNLHQLFKRFSSLGIMGDQLSAPLETPQYHSDVMFEGDLNWTHINPRDTSLSDMYDFSL